jgi:hypothetical protein
MLLEKERGLLLVSLEAREEFEEAIREGIFVYGECCKTAPYRTRRARPASDDKKTQVQRMEGHRDSLSTQRPQHGHANLLGILAEGVGKKEMERAQHDS